MRILRTFKGQRLLWAVIISFILLIVTPGLSLIGSAYTLENNLSTMDVTRSSLLFIFDSLLLLVIVLVPMGLLLLATIKRRLKVIQKISVVVIVVILLITPSIFYANSQGIRVKQDRETPLVNKVIIITFDGTRADAFWKHADFIIKHKNESAWAQRIVCTYPTVTYPNHISLFTGTWPQIHGTESNPTEYRSIQFMLRKYRKPVVEDIFEVAERYGIVTAVFSAPETLASILGGTNTYRVSGGNGRILLDKAIQFLENNKGEINRNGLLAWIHLVDPDDIMHQYGTSSIQYFSTIKAMAELVGTLYQKIYELGWEKDTVIIVTADHGAVGNRHYGVWPPLVADIPLWMWGQPFKRGFRLGGGRIIDIAPTVAFILGIPPPSKATGIILYRAFNETYVDMIRGDINLEKLALTSLNKALWSEYLEVLLWGVLDLIMAWILIIEIMYLFKNLRILLKKEKELKKTNPKTTK